jgi:hypothetical protein
LSALTCSKRIESVTRQQPRDTNHCFPDARQPTHSPSYHEPRPLPSWPQLVVARSRYRPTIFLRPTTGSFSILHARNERFPDSGIFRIAFERVVGACIGAGLVGGEGFAVDASLIVADANKQRSIPGPRWNKELDAQAVGRATKEYLARLDDAAFGAASKVIPKFVSPSDPAAQWTGAMRGPAFFAYSDNYLIDVKCRGVARHPPGRGERGQDYDQAHRATL